MATTATTGVEDRTRLARRLVASGRGLPRNAASGGGESEKLAWLTGTLARIDMEDSYHEIAR
ncbi:hypothetical protein ACN28C_21180 [Plantactinospora sp. WMMC1484]|uniref:hypothetical protein n=1 Tax=Plantactinospora sp. WMMC1484 TaxID=3404122 RepID=UPI003BF5F2FF